MSSLRKRLGAWSIAWLLCQVGSLSALLPPGCCAAHVAAAAATKECHKSPAAAQCPMHDATGTPCPMHAGAGSQQADRDCAMRGSCSGPAVALGSLFSIPGILLDQSDVRVQVSSRLVTMSADSTPDTPASLDTPTPQIGSASRVRQPGRRLSTRRRVPSIFILSVFDLREQ